MNLVFVGIQGSGKGTQARLLVERCGFKLIEMGGVLRDTAKKNSTLGNLVKKTIEKGLQVDPEIVGEIIKGAIDKNGNKIIYDGFIRNFGNKKTMDEFCPDYKIVLFNLPKDLAIKRLTGRMYDPLSGETFPSSIKINPKTGTKLIKRQDDKIEFILKRIDLFQQETMPVVDLVRSEGKLIEIDANRDLEEVFLDLKKSLNL